MLHAITPIEGAKSKEEISKAIDQYMKQGLGPTLIGQYLKDKEKCLT